MYAFALACLVAVPSVLQNPGAEPEPQARAQPAVAQKAKKAPEAWSKLERLAGGEWIASGEGAPPNFHRFWFGPGKRSIWSHTRSDKDLAAYPKAEAVYYWHPGTKALRSISVAEGGTVADQTLRWNGDTLVTDLDYFVAGSKAEFASRWEFDGTEAYKWSLFSKTPNGLAEAMKVQFGHSDELRPLPEIAPPIFEAAAPLAFLAGLTGTWKAVIHGDSKKNAMGATQFRFEAGGHCLAVRGGEGDAGRRRPFQGIAFWHPGSKSVQYLQIDDRGELREGTVRAEDDGTAVFELQVYAGDQASSLVERWKPSSESTIQIERSAESADGRTHVVQLQLTR